MLLAMFTKRKSALITFFGIVLIFGIFVYWYEGGNLHIGEVTSFEECVKAGNPVMESYPEQCRTKDGKHFTRNVGNELEKSNFIRIASPRPGDAIANPLKVRGEARGYWFFEASFPVIVTDWNGQIIGEGYAQAQGDWMTEEFVPFEGEIAFDVAKIQGGYSDRGTLILKKDNPSGLPEHDDALEIPVIFADF